MAKSVPINYTYAGHFDMTKFADNMNKQFKGDARFSTLTLSNAKTLVGFIQSDNKITDIRWMAYMLGTAYWEAYHTVPQQVPCFEKVVIKKKQTQVPVMGPDHKQKMRTIQVPEGIVPIDEIGHGKHRDYHMPVKVFKLPDGSARITENDGDQFQAFPNGKMGGISKRKGKTISMQRRGATDGAESADAYDDDPGTPLSYYGRGYVQLTWWDQYAATGVAIGRGLALLFDPELAKDPAIAYAVMSHGMRTGEGFANGHKFSNYFAGKTTNYVGARHMVNGTDHCHEVAAYAQKFEKVLLLSKQEAKEKE